jgi:hypothetical protein
MSKVGIVTDRGTSQKGKATIHIDNQLYYAGNTDLGTLTVGDQVEFDASSFADGKLWGINKGWKLVKGVNKYAPSVPQPQGPIAAPARPHAAPERAPNEAELRFISNCVGSAISAGTIKEPEQIEKWTSAARNALREQMP